MKDMYIRREKSRKGCLGFIIVTVLIVIGIALYWFIVHPAVMNEIETEEVTTQDPSPIQTEQLTEKIEPYTPPPGSDTGRRDLVEAKQYIEQGNYTDARAKLYDVLDKSKDTKSISEAKSLLGEIHIDMLFTPRDMKEKVDYTVQSGDSLSALAKKFNTTVDLIRKGNNISGSIIRIGDRYRIFSGNFAIEVDKSDNILVLYLNDRFFKKYRVGTGQYNRTPVGEFEIVEKIAQPTWWRPDGRAIPYGDKENLLGTHWLSLNIRGYGIHGTWEPDTIGQQASAGCIRLLNKDVEELYTIVPEGTPVKISD